jgi:Zn-dependent metalloprotease
MRSVIIFSMLLVKFSAFGQKWEALNDADHVVDRLEATMTRPDAHLTDTVLIRDFLKNYLVNLKHQAADVVVWSHTSSPKGEHYLFHQTLNGRPVFRGTVKVNTDKAGHVLSVFDHTRPVPDQIDPVFPNHQLYHDGLMVHYEHADNGQLHHYRLEEVYFPGEFGLEPAIRLEVAENTDRHYELVLNKDVKVVYQNDLLMYAAPPETDSAVTAWVFLPDPLTSANQNYGSPYSDQNDQDVTELNAQRTQVQINVTLQNDTFFLRNAYASIEDYSAPFVAPAFSLSPSFNFTRAQDGFEDVNAYYHVNAIQQHMQQLGFADLVNYPIAIDVHALSGSDNSNFNPAFSPPRLQFGEGGVDDAEDADVVVHEYGHAIMHSAAPNTNNGTQRKTLDEAVGDYFASSYSRAISSFRWEDVFTWDGHNEYWLGRSSVSSDHYPEDLQNNIYSDADIWSATLMQVWGDIGRDVTDAIMLQAAYSFSENMTMPQAALLFLQADTLLFNGAHFTPIRQRMFDRGLLPWNVGSDEPTNVASAYSVSGTGLFAAGNGVVSISGPNEFLVTVFDAAGRMVLSSSVNNGQFSVSPDGLRSGLYLFELRSQKGVETLKVVRH